MTRQKEKDDGDDKRAGVFQKLERKKGYMSKA